MVIVKRMPPSWCSSATVASSKCSGRMPAMMSRLPALSSRDASSSGSCVGPNGSVSVSPSSVAGRKFIAGEPMKPATNGLTGSSLPVGCADEREQAFVVFVAGGAAFEVRAHAGDLLVGGCGGELELDVVVELIEALLAGELRAGGAEELREELRVVRLVGLGHEKGSVSPRPRAARAPRSLCRASWMV